MIVFNQFNGSRFLSVSANRGVVEPLLGTDPTIELEFPQFLPDNRHFLFSRIGVAGAAYDGICVGSIDSGEPVQLIQGLTNARYAAGYLLYMQNDQLDPKSTKSLVFVQNWPGRITDAESNR